MRRSSRIQKDTSDDGSLNRKKSILDSDPLATQVPLRRTDFKARACKHLSIMQHTLKRIHLGMHILVKFMSN